MSRDMTILDAADQSANIDAINEFISGTQPLNDKARKLQDEWIVFYRNLGWFSKSLDPDNGDKAFNIRNEFIRANVASKAELEKVNQFLSKTPAINPVTGKSTGANAAGDRPMEKEPLIPTMYKAIGVAAGAVVVTLVGLKKLHIL